VSVKISIRTVPNQNSDKIKEIIINHLNKVRSKGIKLNIKIYKNGSDSIFTNPKNSISHLAAIKSFKNI
jgi:hypothetical protein